MKDILKKIIFPAVALFSFGFVACDDDKQDINYNIIPGDELYFPRNGFEIDLGTRETTTFEWAPAIAQDGGYISYMILFDKVDGNFSNPVISLPSQLTGSQPKLTLSAKELNRVARAFGLEKLQTGTFKWTVVASKGIFGSQYSQTNTITVTTMNALSPLPVGVTLEGTVTEDPEEGIAMAVSDGIDGVAAEEATFECFTRLSAGGTFTVTDDQGRYYALNANGTMSDSATPVSNSVPAGAGIYWFKMEFDGMLWNADKVSNIEYYAASWVDATKTMTTDRVTMNYQGKGVWELLDYDNHVSVNDANDTRHRFDLTMADGSKYFLGTKASLGNSYTTEYLKVHIYTWTKDDNDWNFTFNFLRADCGRHFDGYLYMNGDNPAKSWWHEYKFK